jgi:hypothetical protein
MPPRIAGVFYFRRQISDVVFLLLKTGLNTLKSPGFSGGIMQGSL